MECSGQPGLHSEFKASLSYIVRPSKNKPKNPRPPPRTSTTKPLKTSKKCLEANFKIIFTELKGSKMK
jgi:hypothetical protein